MNHVDARVCNGAFVTSEDGWCVKSRGMNMGAHPCTPQVCPPTHLLKIVIDGDGMIARGLSSTHEC